MILRNLSALIFCLGIISSSFVFSQKKSLEVYELFDVSLEDLLNVGIVSASKKKQSVTDAPATAYVFTKQNIDVRGYRNLMDLLQDVPEVEIQNNSDKEFKNRVTIRGVSGNEKFLILLDGVRITPATGDHYTFGTQFSLANAERVEVVIGPASALYGVDAFSGIINIITKTFEGNEFSGAQLSTSYGLYNTTNNSFVAGGKVDKLQLSVCGQFFHSDEVDLQNSYKDDFSWYQSKYLQEGKVIESNYYNKIEEVGEFERWAGSSFTGASLGREMEMPTQSYFLSADLHSGEFSLGFSRLYERHSSGTGVDPRYGIRDADAFIATAQNNINIKHRYSSFNKKWRLNSMLRMNHFEYDPSSNFAGASSRWQRGYVYGGSLSNKLQEQLEYDFSRKLTVITGVSLEFLSATPRTGLSPREYDPTDPTNQVGFYYIGAAGYLPYLQTNEVPVFNEGYTIEQEIYNLSYTNLGGYGQVQWSVNDQLEVTAGARYDYNTRYGGSVNPRLGIVFKPTSKFRAKFLYGESFLAPSPAKAFSQEGSFYDYDLFAREAKADFFHISNPNLSPEKLRSAELSSSYYLLKNLSVGANGFYTSIENLIDLFATSNVENPVVSGQNISATRVETSENKGTSTIYGGTMRVNYLLKTSFNIVLNLYGAYSFIDGDDDGEELSFTAKHTVKGGLDVMHKKWSIAPIFRFRSASKTTMTDGVNGSYYSSPAFVVMDLNIRYHLIQNDKAKLVLFTRFDNVTNLKYYNVNVGSGDSFALTPQDPFRVLGGATYSF